jgi:D-proline reductase (dithiol) PrdB
MAKLTDLRLAHQLFMRTYPYRHVDWRPGTILQKPLAEARIALVTTAGLFTPDQTPFDASMRGGDHSFRVIPSGTEVNTLRIAHRSDAFDIRGIESDKNLALPFDRFRTLVEEGVVGSMAPRHFSFMGSITAPGRLIATTAPEVERMLLDDAVDAVLLTPV